MFKYHGLLSVTIWEPFNFDIKLSFKQASSLINTNKTSLSTAGGATEQITNTF